MKKKQPSKATVTTLINRLAQQGYLEKTKRGVHRITKKGYDRLLSKGMITLPELAQEEKQNANITTV